MTTAVQPVPFVPPEYPPVKPIHERAMSIAADAASKMYALVALDETMVREYDRYRTEMRVRSYRRELDFGWQFNGQQYPLDDPKTGREGKLKLGERVWVPLLVAQYGVRQSGVWPYDPASRPGEPVYDFLQGAPTPRLRILDFRTPEDTVEQMKAIKPVLARCSYCQAEVEPELLGTHIEANHLEEILERSTKRQSAKSPDAKKAVADWAEKQRAGGPEAA